MLSPLLAIPELSPQQNKFYSFFKSRAFKKGLKISLISLASFLLLGISGWFVFRGKILNYAWEKAENKLRNKGYTLACEVKQFSGLFEVTLQNINLNLKDDTLFHSNKVIAGISIWESIFNGPALSDLELEHTRINLINRPDYCNFCGLKSSSSTKEETGVKEPLTQRLFDLLKRGMAKIPANFRNNNFSIKYTDSSDVFGVSIPGMTYLNNDLDGILLISENERKTGFAIKGFLNRKKITGKLEIKPQTGQWAELPVLKRKLGIAAGFQVADFELEELSMSSGVLQLVADGHFKGVTIDDRRIADTNVVINDCSGKLVANFGQNFIEIDSSTSLSLNKIKTNLYLRADLGESPKYTVKFGAQKIAAQAFFQSLPEGMFSHLKGIEATGELEYNLYVHLDDKEPYKAKLESSLKPYNFKITKMGETDLRKMNGSFVHTFYDRGRPVRSFTVGPSNPSFTPLDQIPEILQKAVMTGEDPAFFGHNGFYQEAFRQSIAQNYVRKRFARGGSTISMQLVKNVFLSRKKTIARKAEEILIVWLIESQRLTSKSRMFEVYLNVIEWGPGVFGVGEAAPFYFSKSPAELAPLECAFLASIVPAPKSYRYFLDSAGFVSEKNWNFVAIRNRMITKGLLDPADSASFNVKITGPAANYLLPKEELPDEEEQEVLSELLEVIPKRRK